jgi:hypothetical protein
VLSTRPSSPLTIAFRRAEVRAFWIGATLACAVLFGGAAFVFGADRPWHFALAALALPLPGLVQPRWFEFGIRAWNKAVRVSRGAMQAYVLKAVYFLLFCPLGRAGSSLDVALRQSEVSRWISRNGHKRAFGDCDRPSAGGGWWGRQLLLSAKSLGSAWQIVLLPAVLLLLLLRDESQESAIPSNTYTLY